MLSAKARYSFAMTCLMAVMLLLLGAGNCLAQGDEAAHNYGADEARRVSDQPERWVTTDHSRHPQLQGTFENGTEVTAACLSCHNEAANQIHKTIHWTWKCPHDPDQKMGKYALTVNNFCIAVPSNEPRCTSCHAGYGFSDNTFDFTSQDNVDCLVCHDTTGTYVKFPAGAGNPVKEEKVFPGNGRTYYPPDWNKVAQSVGRPSRKNCGTCHFFGGGGDGVKHGDLDSSLTNPSKELDIHMSADGANFDCVRCHTTEAHSIAGRCYKKPAFTERTSLLEDDAIKRISCESCHTDKPHEPDHKANDHTDKVACQSCHIPQFARRLPTKIWWDWSEAGRLNDEGKPYKEKVIFEVDGKEIERETYFSNKGVMEWATNVEPEYFWFNGSLDYILLTDTINPDEVVELNHVVGERNDPNARIYPFKVHRGRTPYDAGNNTMAVPHLFGKDPNAYWGNYDWTKALAAGMEYAGLDFSGEPGFVDTVYHYPITHMVAPADKALACNECHSRDGRLAQLAGFYMPGRDASGGLDTFGWILVIGTLGAALLHGLKRMMSKGKRG